MPRSRVSENRRAVTVEVLVKRESEKRAKFIKETTRRLSLAYDFRDVTDPARIRARLVRQATAFNETFRERHKPAFALETRFIYEEAQESLAKDLVLISNHGRDAYQTVLDISRLRLEMLTPAQRSLARRFIARYMREPCALNVNSVKLTKGLMSYMKLVKIVQQFAIYLHRVITMNNRTKNSPLREQKAAKQIIRRKRSKRRGERYTSKKYAGKGQIRDDTKVSLESTEAYKEVFRRLLRTARNLLRQIGKRMAKAIGLYECTSDAKDCGVYILPLEYSKRKDYDELSINKLYDTYYYRRDRRR